MKLLGNLTPGLLFVLSAPAGTGKTTLVQKLVKEFKCIVQSISYTTRPPRSMEVGGDHYHFVSIPEFEKKIGEGDFLEYVKLYDDYYGTSKTWVEKERNKGRHVILVIDTQGALQLMESLQACFVFLEPPSLEALRHRLELRGTDTEEAINKRLAWAAKELESAKFYHYRIMNDDLDTAYQALRSIVIAEEHKVR